ncbi:aldo/keto reductase [Alphaproteobacteria bacterium]|nr:aldo/keto reductase [Alphaproteobacteria bacterium]
MKYRKLSSTELNISEIGFGSWGIGGVTPGSNSYGPTDDLTSIEALNTAFENGINFFDTSNIYGLGHSEELIGKTFQHKRKDVLYATKLGMKDFKTLIELNKYTMSKSLDDSLTRLKTDYIDLLQLHNVPIDTLIKNPTIIQTLQGFKKQGKTREIGLSLQNPNDLFKIASIFDIKIFQLNLNLLDMRLLNNEHFKKIKQSSIGIIARTPFCFGFLVNNFSKNYHFDKKDHRSTWSQIQRSNWSQNAKKMFMGLSVDEENIKDKILTALRFCLTVPNVSSVLPGMVSKKEVLSNIKASSLGNLSNEIYNQAIKIYKELDFKIEK